MLWKSKLARNLDDVLHLLNGETKFDLPVPDARICMTWRGDHPQFWVFALKAARANTAHGRVAGWGWKLATEPDDVLRFLRGEDPYSEPVGQAQIAAAWTGDHYLFYVFHRETPAGLSASSANWEWRRTTDSMDAVHFLNGRGAYAHPAATARIATVYRDHHEEYFIFSRPAPGTGPLDDWRWEAVGSAADVRSAVEHKGHPPVDFQVGSPPAGHGIFQLFVNPAARMVPAALVENGAR
jgi:hypothetical protein